MPGTGSVAYSYVLDELSRPSPARRAGGYGALLGDDGSGFHVGKRAITETLVAQDQSVPLSTFHNAVLEHFGCLEADQVDRLLERVLQVEATGASTNSVVSRIASVCKSTLDFAFSDEPDPNALSIAHEAVDALILLVKQLGLKEATKTSILILGGSLFRSSGYRRLLLSRLEQQDLCFSRVEMVENAGEAAAYVLATQML